MPERNTLADALDMDQCAIAPLLNMLPTDSRVVRYINRAMRRLLAKGKWVGTYQKYQVCVYSGCLTWPRQFEAIEEVAVCGMPITIRNEWFEFNGLGTGLRKEIDECATQLYDRGMAVAFEDIHGVNKKLKVYCDIDQGPTPNILLQGYDEDGNWIRTLVSGSYVDGEYVTPSVTGTLTDHIFTALTGVQKPLTDGNIRLYEFNTDDSTERAIAIYEPDETRPVYRRSLIAGLSNIKACCNTTPTDCNKKIVTVMAKMAFLPVRNDTDWLIISNLSALEAMVQAVRKEDNNMWDEAKKYELQAEQILQEQLNSYLGDSPVIAVKFPSPTIYGGAVGNVLQDEYGWIRR